MQKVEDLIHQETPIEGGGVVIVLNTGSVIDAESAAMLQALHSRSTGGLKSHLKILSEKGAENFMKNFYVGYGHKSIGDCGTTSIFVEGISMLAAKAIQDWPLYSGQESSTRYVDFKTLPFKNPAQTQEGAEILEIWRDFYIRAMEPTKAHLTGIFPRGEGEDEKIYNKAIAARAFDILRGFLPAGATTNLAWHTNLRQAADKIMILRHHPLQEVKNIAEAIDTTLRKAYPNSFGHKMYDETEKYNDMWMKSAYYHHDTKCPEFNLARNNIDTALLNKDILKKRPPKTELPKYLAEAGTLQFEFLLDFGSFRDIQRHRAVIQRMPLLTDEIGFEEWYLQELSRETRIEAEKVLSLQKEKISKLNIPKEERQYYLAMGYKVANRLTGGLPAIIYLAELRATRFVHPTLRIKAKMMADALSKEFDKYELKIHLDPEIDRFDIKRGEHDIVLK